MTMDKSMPVLRKTKRKKTKEPSPHPTEKDMQIVKYLRFKVPRKSTVIQKQSVEYFAEGGCNIQGLNMNRCIPARSKKKSSELVESNWTSKRHKAVDVLMESKWATKKCEEYFICSREEASKYMNELLAKRFFYRAMRNKQETKVDSENKVASSDVGKNTIAEEKEGHSPNELRRRKVEKHTTDSDEKTTRSTKTKESAKSKKKEKAPKEKVKKRYKLTVHDEQMFLDTKDLYVWIYNPISTKTMLMGTGVLLCVVAATLFPLWPPQVRLGVYYVSLAGGGFIGSIFVIALARSILYGLLWIATGGKHHLWILPNILADVGFFDSFKPFYTYEYRGKTDKQQQQSDDQEGKESGDEGNQAEAEEKDNSEEDGLSSGLPPVDKEKVS